MPILVWDEETDRVYESGLDRGVLYLPDGSVVPWNGLTSVIESFDKEVSPVYFDGMKISDNVSLGNFSATMKALTYPDEFSELEGLSELKSGIFAGDQMPQLFGLSYRTRVGNAVEGSLVGYKIHILYNVTAIPSDKTYSTISDEPELTEFEWNLTAVPEEIPGIRPTSHFIIDSTEVDPWLLEELEEMLYGSSSADAALISMYDLVSMIRDWYRIKIIDNGDGTWTAISRRDESITMLTADIFEITGATAVYLDEDTYLIADT